MKYLIKFESSIDNRYPVWKVPTGDKLRIALRKIGLTDEEISIWINFNKYPAFETEDFIYIMERTDDRAQDNIRLKYVYMGITELFKNNSTYKYMGEVKVFPWEVDMEKNKDRFGL